MDLSVLAKDAVCHMCSKTSHFSKDNQVGGKGKTGAGKGTKAKDGDAKEEGACHNCDQFGHFARECQKEREQHHASCSGVGDAHDAC